MAGMEVANLIRKRDVAVRINDWNLVREIDAALARHGVTVTPPKVEEGAAVYERAVAPPVKRGPGRPRKVQP